MVIMLEDCYVNMRMVFCIGKYFESRERAASFTVYCTLTSLAPVCTGVQYVDW